jgi:hypothetical protein
MPRERVRRADGRRDWPAIRRAAEAAIRRGLRATMASAGAARAGKAVRR